MERPNPDFFYTQPTFRADSPDFAKAKGQTDWTLDTPGIGLVLAIDYYRFEAFATERERNARCGATGHRDVRYAPATAKDLRLNKVALDSVACGHDVNHPQFDAVVSPLFDAAFRRLIRDASKGPRKTEGTMASTDIVIARTRYVIKAEAVGTWMKFPISGMAMFGEGDRDITNRTLDWLEHRIALTASPSMFDATPN